MKAKLVVFFILAMVASASGDDGQEVMQLIHQSVRDNPSTLELHGPLLGLVVKINKVADGIGELRDNYLDATRPTHAMLYEQMTSIQSNITNQRVGIGNCWEAACQGQDDDFKWQFSTPQLQLTDGIRELIHTSLAGAYAPLLSEPQGQAYLLYHYPNRIGDGLLSLRKNVDPRKAGESALFNALTHMADCFFDFSQDVLEEWKRQYLRRII